MTIQVEYILVKFNDEKKTAHVSLRAEEILATLREAETANPEWVNILALVGDQGQSACYYSILKRGLQY